MKFALKNTPVYKFPAGSGPAETPEELMQALKNIRGWMLTESDWTQVSDCPLPPEVKEQWRLWRQEMRDITDRINIDNVQDWFEVTDPPSTGFPPAWAAWEYTRYNEMISALSHSTNPGH